MWCGNSYELKKKGQALKDYGLTFYKRLHHVFVLCFLAVCGTRMLLAWELRVVLSTCASVLYQHDHVFVLSLFPSCFTQQCDVPMLITSWSQIWLNIYMPLCRDEGCCNLYFMYVLLLSYLCVK